MKRHLILILICCSVKVFFSQNTKEIRYSNALPIISSSGAITSAIVPGSSISFTDIYFTKSINCYNMYTPSFWVAFEYDLNSKNTILNNLDFNAELNFKVEYWDVNNLNTSNPASGSYTSKLILNHKKELKDRNTFYSKFNILHSKSIYHVKLTVLNGTNIPVGYEKIFNVKIAQGATYFQKELFSQINRFSFIKSVNGSTATINWEKVKGSICDEEADEYDVEWSFIDGKSEEANIYSNYLNNSLRLNTLYDNPFTKLTYSRLTTKQNSISNLPLLYPDGYLVLRIREVYYTPEKKRIEGEWISYNVNTLFPPNSLQSFFIIPTEHQPNLNWMSSISFAEEARHKGVITYYDGTQRDRQVVTMNNSDRVPVIAESIYDREGRKAANILPSPDYSSKDYNYFIDFNKSNKSGFAYNNTDIEEDKSCNVTYDLSTSSGASNYYSTANRFNINLGGKHAFVPNAEGFPIEVSKFSNDNLSRVIAKGGVGKEFQLGNRDTKFYFGKAASEEIDRLFGTDVGDNSHYFKNMTLDPNGQISVSYLDMAGKTIATALAGNASNTALINNTNNPGSFGLRYNILPSKYFVVDKYNEVAYNSASHLVTGNQTMTFYVNANSESYDDSCKKVVCSDCYYDLNVKVNSNCIVDARDYEATYKNYKDLNKIDTNCNTHLGVIADSFSLPMPTGEFYVSAKVTIPEEAIRYYTDRYLENGTCFPSLDSLIKKHKARMTPCIKTCEQCNAYYGNVDNRVDSMMAQLKVDGQVFADLNDSLSIRASLVEYAQAAKDGCASYCEKKLPCDIAYQLLKVDVSPGGQYALFYDTTNTAFYKDSAINCIEDARRSKPGWRFNSDNTSVINNSTLVSEGIRRKNGQNFDLTTGEGLNLLVAEWEDEFTNKLIKYHPEYCYYEYCAQNTEHHAFFDSLDQIETWEEAVAKNLVGNNLSSYKNSSDLLIDRDPFFKSGGSGVGYYQKMKYLLQNIEFLDVNNNNRPISIFDLAMIHASPRLWKYNQKSRVAGGFVHLFNYKYLDTCDCDGLKDIIWNQFKFLYKNIVLYKYDELRVKECDNRVPKLIGALNKDIREMDKGYMFFASKNVTIPFPSPNYYFKMPRFFDYNTINQDFKTAVNSLVRDVNGNLKTKQQMQDESNDKLKKQCDTNCMSLADGWLAALSDCFINTLSVSEEMNLKEDLVAVCQSSCGSYLYGFGAKTTIGNVKSVLLPHKNVYVSSFQDVIDLYKNNAGNILCSQDMIDFPPVSDTAANLNIEQGNMLKKDPCVCSKLASFVDMNVALNDIEDLHARLKAKFGTIDYDISSKELEEMIKLCKKKDTICEYAPSAIRIPNIFSCNNYVTCDQFNRAQKNLAYFYPALANRNTRETQFGYTKLYTNFLNRFLKVNFTYKRYQSLLDSCKNCVEIQDCAWFIKVYNEFKTLEGESGGLLSASSTSTTEAGRFADYLNGVYGMNMTLEDVYAKMEDCGIIPNCNSLLACLKNYKNYIQSTYSLEIENQSYNYVYLANMAGYMNGCLFNFGKNYSMFDYIAWLKHCGEDMEPSLDCNQFEYFLRNYEKKTGKKLDPKDNSKTDAFKEYLASQLNVDKSSFNDLNIQEKMQECLFCELECEVVKKLAGGINPNSPSKAEIEDLQKQLQDQHPECKVTVLNVSSMFNKYCFACKLTCIEIRDMIDNNGLGYIFLKDGSNKIFGNHLLSPAIVTDPTGKKSYYSYTDKLNLLYNKLKKEDCILDRNRLEELALNLRNDCDKFCDPFPCWDPNGGGSGGTSGGSSSSSGGTTSGGGSSCDNCEPVDDCCEKFKIAWDKFHNKNVFDTAIWKKDLFGILSAIKSSSIYTSVMYSTTGCTWDEKIIEQLIKDCLKITIKFKDKGFPDDDYDPESSDEPEESGKGTGTNTGGTGPNTGGTGTGTDGGTLPGDDGSGSGGGGSIGLPCCKIQGTSCPSKDIVVSDPKLNSIEAANLFNAPYAHNAVLAYSAAAIALPPASYPHPFDNINISWCDKILFDRPIAPMVEIDMDVCEKQMERLAIAAAMDEYQKFREAASQNFRRKYIEKCLNSAQANVWARGMCNEFQYTLYYYGQDGNLLRTVPPAGVNPIPTPLLGQVPNKRESKLSYPAIHSLPTEYKYNSLNQVYEQTTPDAGTSRFVYDELGRLIVSQHASQALSNKYSYTLYDAQSRIVESGELEAGAQNMWSGYFGVSYIPYNVYKADLTALKTQSTSKLRYVTRTYYDKTAFAQVSSVFERGTQENLRKRIASITLDTLDIDKGADASTYHTALHYTYDLLGNVKSLVSENKLHSKTSEQYKRIDYDYDLVSGKVNKVSYQKEKADQFLYRYGYDAENRIVKSETSLDGMEWEEDAHYDYYLHGPLARMELGEQEVQGVDYAYTLQGWLKSINASTLHTQYDMGNDGHSIGQNKNTARDAVAFSLRYFQNDYSQIGRSTAPVEASLPTAMNSLNLYNGNISSQTVSLKGVQNPTQSYQYRYDQLNRLVRMDVYRAPVVQNNNLSAATLTTDYQERISYDPNGNILTYSRKKDGGADMDNLTYTYDAQKKNQLKQVQDAVQDGAYNLDIDNQTNTQNYKYDAIGNLIRDEQEDMDISWTPTGKIAKINQNKKKIILTFAYDPMGNRVTKTVTDMLGKKKPFTTYYTRDAQGNTLAVYDNHFYENNIKWCTVRREEVLEAMDKVIEWEQNCATQRDPQCKIDQYESYQSLLAAKDSCKYKIQAYIYQQQMPCALEPQYIDFLEQLYNQDHDSYTQLDPAGQEDYLNTKEQEYGPQVQDAIGCFMTQLRYVINMDIAQRDEYLNAYRNGTLKDQLTDKYYNELAGQQLAYGQIIDTAYTDSLYWKEQHLYGSSRLGMAKPNIEVTNYRRSTITAQTSNYKNYELTNHLGNVLATIKDEKQQIDANNDGLVDYYEPIVMTATDYYPFGMPMPNRSFTLAPSEGYRFGFNTQEKDDEVYGAGNLNTAMFWEYDTRLGRRWNLDPKPRVGISDYSVMDGNPIWKNDVLGDEPSKKEAWAMSKIVYGKNDKATARARKILEKGGWEVSKETFGIKKEGDNGFKSELFVRTDKEGTEYAYATTGTENGDKKDWTKGNLPQFIGLSDQYSLSMKNADKISQGTKGKELTFTGHSLGGGLAVANAYATGGRAITFNPAGVSGLTLANIAVNYGFKMVFAKIDAHILITDPLNVFNAVTTRTDGIKHLYKPTDGASYTDGHSLDNLGKSLGIKW